MMVVLFQEEQLDEIFNEIASKIDGPIEGFLIGGLAMIKNKMKTATKDIDIVFENEDDARTFIEAARSIGFEPDREYPPEYEEMDAMIVLRDDEERRIDVFVKVVHKGLIYKDTMKSRAKEIQFNESLIIRVSSNADIFLYKSITSRHRDLEDMEILARTGDVDWEIIKAEARSQPTPWKWLGSLYGKLLELEERTGIVTPLMSLEEEAEIAQAIEILIRALDNNPLDKEEAECILGEDERFVHDVLTAMKRYGLVKETDGIYHLI